MGADGPLYAFSLFLPSIINQLGQCRVGTTKIRFMLTFKSVGFTATPANLLTVPVYVLACAITCFVGFMADRLGHRGYFTMLVPVPFLWTRSVWTFAYQSLVNPFRGFFCVGKFSLEL